MRVEPSSMARYPTSKVRFGSTHERRLILPHCCIAQRLARSLPFADRSNYLRCAPSSPQSSVGLYRRLGFPQATEVVNRVQVQLLWKFILGMVLQSISQSSYNSVTTAMGGVGSFDTGSE
jgi:hypothetical protein